MPTSDPRSTRDANELTRSEEALDIATVSRPATRVRVRKQIVTEMVTTVTPVSREELAIEEVPIVDGDPAALPTADELEFVLHTEEIVVEKRVVAIERVRLSTVRVTEQLTIDETLRAERIELEDELGT